MNPDVAVRSFPIPIFFGRKVRKREGDGAILSDKRRHFSDPQSRKTSEPSPASESLQKSCGWDLSLSIACGLASCGSW